MDTPFTTPAQLFSRAKWAFSTRRVVRIDAAILFEDVTVARPGDLVLGRVMSIGSHKRIQSTAGRPITLFQDDLVVLACGARYASDQFEGIARLDPDGAAMLAGGGCIGEMRLAHASMRAPTRIKPLGLMTAKDGRVLNLTDYALPATAAPCPGQMPCLGVVGAAMNAGKTTAPASLIHGLTAAGCRVAGIKATGTGAYGDLNAYQDAGAHAVADFTDTGFVSTYQVAPERIIESLERLLAHAEAEGCDVAVVEIADGLLQQETAALLSAPRLRAAVGGWIYACGDAMAAVGGLSILARQGITPTAVTGLVSASPLAAREMEAETGIAPLKRAELMDPVVANALLLAVTPAQALAA